MTGDYLSLLPIMAEGKMDYVNGSYKANIEKHSSGGIKVKHSLAGESLVAQLVKEQKADFACEVISPQTTYRTIETSQDAEQIVNWNKDNVLVDNLSFHPMVLASVKKEEKYKLESKHGVHAIWHGKTIKIQKGTLLADGVFHNAVSNMQKLFSLIKDDSLHKGAYRVEEKDLGLEFKFYIFMATDLFDAMQTSGIDRNFKDAILSGVFASALNILHSKESENDEPWGMKYQSLAALAEEFENKDIPLWGEDTFHADECATRYKPIKLESDKYGD